MSHAGEAGPSPTDQRMSSVTVKQWRPSAFVSG